MRDFHYDLFQVYHQRFRLEEAAIQLKTMRQAPPNTYLPKQIRSAALNYDFWRNRLRMMEHILRKYHPDQPRVPAGNGDESGRWTNVAGASGYGTGRSSSFSVSPTASTSGQRRTNPDHIQPASFSSTRQDGKIEFHESQKAELRKRIGSGKGAYVEAYKYLHQQVQNRLKNSDLSIADRKELESQEFWLRKAMEINNDDPNSQANFFIRNVTANGLRFDDKPADREKIQANSNRIGEFVLNDIQTTGKMPSMQRIITQDALAATGNEGGQTYGGWGGAFNYWDMPLPIGGTVGSYISDNPAEYEKFIAVNAKALAETVRKFRLDRYPDSAAEAILQGLNAQVPARIKSEILDRAIDGINGERGGFAGDPYNINGYHPRLDKDDNVIGWYSRDKRLKETDVSDRAKISDLNTRYNVRQSKGEFHPWQSGDQH